MRTIETLMTRAREGVKKRKKVIRLSANTMTVISRTKQAIQMREYGKNWKNLQEQVQNELRLLYRKII